MIKGLIETALKAVGVPVGTILATIQTIVLAIQYVLEFGYNVADWIMLNIDKFILNMIPRAGVFGKVRVWLEDRLITILDKRLEKIPELKKKIRE